MEFHCCINFWRESRIDSLTGVCLNKKGPSFEEPLKLVVRAAGFEPATMPYEGTALSIELRPPTEVSETLPTPHRTPLPQGWGVFVVSYDSVAEHPETLGRLGFGRQALDRVLELNTKSGGKVWDNRRPLGPHFP